MKSATFPSPEIIQPQQKQWGRVTAWLLFVALMVVEHQSHVQNVMTRAGWEVRNADVAGQGVPSAVEIAQLAEPLVRGLLFVGEAPLGGHVQGTSGFRRYFESLGIRDGQGRSLRDVDLTLRLFRYPLSYLIHSDAFGALPDVLKTQVFGRILEVTSGRDASGDFNHITVRDRSAILEILRETHTDFEQWLAERETGH